MGKLKGCFKSLTIWVNTLLLTVVPFMDTISQAIQATLPSVSQYLTVDLLKGLAVFILLSNIVLRFKTNKSLGDK